MIWRVKSGPTRGRFGASSGETMRTCFGPFTFDSALRLVTCGGREIHLTPKAFDLLALLLTEAGRVVTKQELHERLWPDTFVADATLIGLVKTLRRKLDDRDARAPIIRTTHGVGYAFVAPIDPRCSDSEERDGFPRQPFGSVQTESEASSGPSRCPRLISEVGDALPRISPIAVNGRSPVASHPPVAAAVVAHPRHDQGIGRVVPAQPSVATGASVAVLPFTHLSPTHDQAYLGEGVAEELIHALSGIDGLRVSSPSSSFQFAGKAVNIQDVGARLGVETILEGSLRTAGDRLHLTARLVDARDGFQRWSARYDRTLGDVFAVQDEIVHAIVANLDVMGRHGERRSARRRHTGDLEAYSLYLQGRHYWARRVKGALQLATACFERAIARDPSYALAYAGLADVYTTSGLYGALPARLALSKANPCAQQAALLNDELSEVRLATACIHAFLEWDFLAAEVEFRRAIRLAPCSGYTHSSFAYLLGILGRVEEADHHATQAVALEPMSPLVRVHVATTLFFARRFEEGWLECQRALTIDPSFALAHWAQCMVLTGWKRYEVALEVVERALNSSWDFPPVAAGWLYTLTGQRKKAEDILQPIRARSPNESRFTMVFAWIALARGEIDEAFAWLDRAYEDRNPLLLQIGVAGLYDCVRDDPRFTTLLKKVGVGGQV
jgi:TolB-like protein/DNA-binding winged helix-turn-helix (wHTH) protein